MCCCVVMCGLGRLCIVKFSGLGLLVVELGVDELELDIED